MLVVPDSGNLVLLELLRTPWTTSKPRLHLYQNDMSPTLTTVLGDFVESTYDGYSAQDLTFSFPIIDGTGHGVLQANDLTFTVTGDNNLPQRQYGCFITDSTDLVLLWAERFTRRVTFRLKDQQFTINPRFGGLSEFTG